MSLISQARPFFSVSVWVHVEKLSGNTAKILAEPIKTVRE